jgi:hypothetical protein
MSGLSFASFIRAAENSMNSYLDQVGKHIRSGALSTDPGRVFLFPSTMLCTSTETHHVFELIGAQRVFSPLVVRRNPMVGTVNRVFGGFDPDDSTVYAIGSAGDGLSNVHLRFENMAFTDANHLATLERRFPGLRDLAPPAELLNVYPAESWMSLDAQSFRTIGMRACFSTATRGVFVRPKLINFLFAESVEANFREFRTDLEPYLALPSQRLSGVQSLRVTDETRQLAAGLMSLYLQNVRETTLTTFLERHDEIVRVAFDADHVFHQPSLSWRDGAFGPTEKAIIPDMIVRTRLGTWSIVDFKLPLLDKPGLTKGPRRRRRFVDAVGEGISQLANYAEYFSTPGNRNAAAEQFGESFENPDLVLVVGNFENYDLAEVEEAKRTYRPVEVIDYDSLVRLFVGAVPNASER